MVIDEGNNLLDEKPLKSTGSHVLEQVLSNISYKRLVLITFCLAMGMYH